MSETKEQKVSTPQTGYQSHNVLKIDRTFKIAILGDSGVGKSTFIKRLETGHFEQTDIAPTVTTLTFTTNVGVINLDVHESPPKCEGFDGALIMFDVTKISSYDGLGKLYKQIEEKVPTIVCGNKIDSASRQVLPKHILFPKQHNLPYINISAKSCYNFDKPFLKLIELIVGDEVVFVKSQAEDEDAY